jgi:tape measure domain-containing protein
VAVSNVELRVNGGNAVRELNRVNGATSKLTNTVKQLAGAFAGVQAFKFIFTKTAELEKQRKSLQVLTGSLKEASKTIKELQQFAAVTPFTSADLIDTAKRLKAFGVETGKIVDTTKRLGDVAGATGAELNGIATAYGQIQAKGKLQTEELLQLQERGIDIASTLKKEYNLTGEEFSKALQKGQISAEAVEFALKELTSTGGQYANGAISQSGTLSGKLSTLQDNVETLARTLGSVLSPVLKGIFDQANQVLSALNKSLAAGRGASFNRQIGAIGAKITFGLTSQSVDDIEKVLSQLSSQKNKTGIQQNITALNQLSNALKRIGASDPNAGRAEELQGRIMRRQREESAALKKVPATPFLGAVKIPELLGGNGGGKGTGRGRAGQGRVDATKELLALQEKLTFSIDTIGERERLILEHKIAQQKIAEQNLLPNEKKIAFLQAEQSHMESIIALEERQTKEQEKRAKKTRDTFDKAMKDEADRAQKQKEADPGFQMQKQFEELIKLENQVAAGATAIGNAFSNAFVGVISGAKSAQEGLAEMMQSVAKHFLDMAAKIIAQQIAMILYGTIMKALGVSMPGGSGFNPGVPSITGNNLSDFGGGTPFFAEGGYVTGPTNAVVGEGGEPEYIIPESKMRESMGRYSRGSRGSSVIPAEGGGAAGTEGGAATAAPIDVRYTVERINSVDYVTADQFQSGMKRAAAEGAQRGQQLTLSRLQQSPATRRRIGM